MEKLNIVVIEGTKRSNRLSIQAAKYVYEIGKTYEEVDISFVDPLDIPLSPDGNKAGDKNPTFTEITAKADGFFIVTPEYNHSYPSSIKRLLDSEYENFHHKVVAFGGVSDGPWGGVRCIEALNGVAKALGLVTLRKDVQFPMVQNIFDENGQPKDAEYEKRIRGVYQELIWMAKTLKYGRQNYN
ncbi:MAG: NADPH-dependent FMN reductase [Candidatus Dojkabacteria bacterium]